MNDLKNMNISIAFLTRNDEFHPFKHFIDLISNDRKIFVANRNAMLECVLNDVNTFCILNDYYEVDNHIVESLVRKKIEDISLKYYLCMFSSLDGEIREEDKNILNFIKNNCVCVT